MDDVSSRSAGGPDSLDAFYDASAARAYGLAIRLLADDRATAEDIVFQTFVAVWQSESRAAEGETADLECMLLRQIRERCIDVLRGRRDAAGTEEDAQCLAPGSSMLATRDRVRSASQPVRDELDALSHDQRASIEQAYFQGSTSSQVAAHAGISRDMVHRAMRSGLHMLKSRLSASRTERLVPAPSGEKKLGAP